MTTDTHAARSEHPVVAKARQKRGEDVQLKIADAITAFAGSMPFVYVHIVVFAVWMLVVEKSPWPTLTLVVSLEAIGLSRLGGSSRPTCGRWTIVRLDSGTSR